MIDFSFPKILSLFEEYSDEKRTNSSAFLIWYLENYYRLDILEAIDSVCDNKGDKGIDGIYINHSEGTIDVFQTKLSEKLNRTLGDTHLKEFVGTLTQLDSIESLNKLELDPTANNDLKRLIKRTNLEQYIGQYTLNGIFISNMELDVNGKAFIEHNKLLKVIGPKELNRNYISNEHSILSREASFSIGDSEYLKYSVNENIYTIVSPIKARELVNIDGIKNQDIFVYNVRGHLGNTAVNKGIVKTIEDSSLHSMFPLFHNGITIVCDKLYILDEKEIKIENFYVVNGCQSLSTLYKKMNLITESLNILVKFVQVNDVKSSLSQTITNYSNNQNGIKARDFKSNHPIQIRLKNDVESNFSNYIFEIKRGEAQPHGKEIISNEELGMWIMAFDRQEPWDTHRKYQIFDDKYNEIFAHPNVNSYRAVFLYNISKIVSEVLSSTEYMKNRLVAKYSLTKYAIFYILREILETDDIGKEVLAKPNDFISDANIDLFLKILRDIIIDIVIDFNYEVNDLGDDFNYREKLRDKSWVQTIRKNIIASMQKEIAKGKVSSFAERWIAK